MADGCDTLRDALGDGAFAEVAEAEGELCGRGARQVLVRTGKPSVRKRLDAYWTGRFSDRDRLETITRVVIRDLLGESMRALTSAGATLAAVGLSLGLSSAPASAAPAAPAASGAYQSPASTTLAALAAKAPPKSGKDSIKCNESNARVNFSWKNGWSSTTVYYNNHCLGGTRITAAFKFYNDGSTPFYKCVTFQGDSQGKYKFAHINEIMDINKDTKKCKKN
ncbi:hypothetical protein AB0C96_37300 [Streptomyces sp. NPDC048506]|uniref:hypothetical protein n=1 Tax=Streptomyces sp. NPDC048506 TaxID=3155028 RepID=UPI0034403700